MALSLLIVVSYLALSFILGIAARKKGGGERDFALGGGLPGLRLFATMAATNFSAFTVFGLSGAGYRIGWAYYPLMGFGTGLMALSFFFLGMPLRRLSAERGYLSPSDFVADRYQCPLLGKAFSLALIALTLPYLATQAVAGGRMLEAATGLPYALASLLVAGVTTLYTLGGGFRAVAATDSLQLIVLYGGVGAAFISIIRRVGGLAGLGDRLSSLAPGLLESQGPGGILPLSALLGSWLLWLLADPLFPQLFQRFYAAKDDRSLHRTAALYPLATGLVFFMTISVGLAGAALLPGLSGTATEQVFARLALAEGNELVSTLFVLAALAALMSTMDSQLLSLSTMIIRDHLQGQARGTDPKASRREAPEGAPGWASGFAGGLACQRAGAGRVGLQPLLVGILGLAAWLVSLRPPSLILGWLTGIAFPGYALLAPPVILGLYTRVGAFEVAISLAAGFTALGLEASGLLSTAPLPQSVFNLCIELGTLAFGLLLRRGLASDAAPRDAVQGMPLVLLRNLASRSWLASLGLLILLTFLAQAFLPMRPLVLGLPPWVMASVLSCLALSLVFWLWRAPARRSETWREPGTPV